MEPVESTDISVLRGEILRLQGLLSQAGVTFSGKPAEPSAGVKELAKFWRFRKDSPEVVEAQKKTFARSPGYTVLAGRL